MRKILINVRNKELIKQAYNTLPIDNVEDKVSNLLKLNLTQSQYVRIALHLSQRTYTGYYSILFNKIAREMLTPEFLQSLPYWTDQDFFPELYNNNTLTLAEKEEVQQRHIKEFTALNLAFEMASESPNFFRKEGESNLPDSEVNDLYSQSYNQICINENLKNTKKLKDVNIATFSSPITYQMIVESHKIYCLPLKELLKSNRVIKRFFPIEVKLIEYAK